ncbi:GNAT family N-acetyltransferase [Anaerosalibacter massiliensis]|uniref:GNAT family N-acetyltransferase n=1 Tax=Anaerosalibacter massiliensis TaxID=1347392 RepID=A0A9X2MKF1_9FIRM|nr:GNAT family protein [Anaerosalibacter massiliensis]MCR2045369.1 GNAT family N-acetyltransferase [Anaerosalibacter massiliensis]
MLKSDRIYLRLMEERDIPFKVRWINDSDVNATLNFDYPISEIGTRNWLNKAAANSSRKDFIVCLRENDRPIGYGGLLDIDIKNSKAESYMGIGETDCWGKGYAREIRTIILEYAFMQLGLNKVYSYVWEENKKMIKVNERAGFKVDGKLREDVFSHGEYRSRLIMSILKSEYMKKNNI